MGFENGQMGAVNGVNANGSLLKDNEQSSEAWTGVPLSNSPRPKQPGG